MKHSQTKANKTGETIKDMYEMSLARVNHLIVTAVNCLFIIINL